MPPPLTLVHPERRVLVICKEPPDVTTSPPPKLDAQQSKIEQLKRRSTPLRPDTSAPPPKVARQSLIVQ
ncbi:hypothetical protein AB1Y20_012319 [Prymnesium parvum]|uniref:Uncharacterized protein n=1 Tax=Prymnesium parvum TaxID=97485 RepID=A0AB34IP36_PRYPA